LYATAVLQLINKIKALKRTILATLIFCFSTSYLIAQSDCAVAAPFCTSTGVTFPAETGNGDAPFGPDYDCLFTTPNPAWYYLNISQSGNINITLTNTNLVDVDFILWGPFANQASMCTAIFNGTAGIEDCSYATDATEYVDITGAIVGQWYMFLITNFSDVPTDIIATQTGGGGATNCSILCTFNGITANPTACVQATQQYSVSGTVTVTDPPSTGTLTITNSCGGAPIVMNPPFASSIPYTFSNLSANGSSCNITATFSADATCTGTVNYNAPAPCVVNLCNMDYLQADIGACDFANNAYDITGYVEFSNAPATGQLIIETCNGQQAVFNPPFVSPLNYSILDITSDGGACDVTAYFSATPACTNSVAYVAPDPCVCAVNAGTFVTTTNGDTNTPSYLCFNDQFNIVSNNDYLFSANVFDDDTLYNPAIWYLVYSCPPTVGQGGSVETDPCLVGTISSQDLIDLNDGSFIAQFPAGTFTNNTVYFTPITMYDATTGTYSFTNFDGMCYDLGPTYTYTYLPEIVEGTSTQNCVGQTLTVSFSGGAPELLGTSFTALNLSPANAFFVDDVAPNNGTIVIGGLLDGDIVTYTIEDQYGCPYSYTSAPFVGPAIPTLTAQNPLCVSDAPVQLIATPAGGTWTGVGVSATGLFNPTTAGVGTEIISYLPAGCALTGTLNILVYGPLDATIVNPGALCIDANPITLTAASPGGTWSGVGITNPATGAFDPSAAGVLTTTITYTIAGNCGDTDTQTITVNPLPVVSFTADVTSGCAPLTVNLTNTSVPLGNGCTWWVDGVPSGNNCSSLNYTFNTQGCYDIMLSTTDGNGCSSNASIVDYICVSQQPVSTFSWSPIAPNVGNTTVQFINYSLGAVSYDWTIMDMYYLNAPEPVFTFPNEVPGEYSVCLLVTNADGCTDLSCGTVAVSDQFSIFVPNCFTPNTDGRNELFKPSIRGESLIQTYEFQIFSRWGDVLFETNDINDGWYGEVDGGEYYAIDAVYSWRIKILPNNGQEPFEQTGHVTVIR
jgi:gliding motility-associated-like protein